MPCVCQEATLSDIAGVKGLSPGKNKNKVKVLRSKARTKLVESETVSSSQPRYIRIVQLVICPGNFTR